MKQKESITLNQEQYKLLLELATLGEIVRTGDRLPDEKGGAENWEEKKLLYYLCVKAKDFGLGHIIQEYDDMPDLKHLENYDDLMDEYLASSERSVEESNQIEEHFNQVKKKGLL